MATITIILVIAIFLFYFFNKSKNQLPPQNSSPPIGKIKGNAKYEMEVVGESFYSDAFETLIRRHATSNDDGGEMFGDAVLRLENNNAHDPMAVGVYIDGMKVGHLSRIDARMFREALVRDGFGGVTEVACGARLYRGGSTGRHSVRLDVPSA